jgi:hypothetical protein
MRNLANPKIENWDPALETSGVTLDVQRPANGWGYLDSMRRPVRTIRFEPGASGTWVVELGSETAGRPGFGWATGVAEEEALGVIFYDGNVSDGLILDVGIVDAIRAYLASNKE